MTIKFNPGTIDEMELEIVGVEYTCDEHGIPVDIFMYGSEESLQKITDFVQAGTGVREIWDIFPEGHRMKERGATHECLFARLPKFIIYNLEPRDV